MTRKRAFVVGGICIAASIVIGVAVVYLPSVTALDARALLALAAHRSRTLNHVAVDVTGLGATPALALALTITAALLHGRGPRFAVAQLLVNVVGTLLADNLVKILIDRPRPTVVTHLVDVQTASFPSGHSMSTAGLACTIALLACTVRPSRRAVAVAWTIALVVTVAVACSRMFLGVHYPSDVLAGALFGIGWACLLHGLLAPTR